jgi:hypothetical protein
MSAKSVSWAWNVAGMGQMGIEYKVAVGKSEGKRAAGRRGRRWWDNIKMCLREIRWESAK